MLILLSIIVFIIMILLLIGFHELGHFIVALLCKVPVKCFSIGFGRPILRWQARNKIEYVLGWLPFGGYVKLIDEREGKPPNLTIKRKVWPLLLVVLAGPIANFILALIAFYAMNLVGKTYVRPVIGEVIPYSIASETNLKPGDQIIAVGRHHVIGWQGVKLRLIGYLGDSGKLPLTIKTQQGETQQIKLNISDWQVNSYQPKILDSLGIKPKLPAKGEAWPKSLLLFPHYSIFSALPQAIRQFSLMFSFNIELLYKLIIGRLPLQMLAGPISLFKSAEIAAKQGVAVFFELIGVLSIALGLINLLPIPGLDGSQVIYLVIEKFRGHSFSINFEVLLFKLGLIFIMLIMLQAIINDFVRWFTFS